MIEWCKKTIPLKIALPKTLSIGIVIALSKIDVYSMNNEDA